MSGNQTLLFSHDDLEEYQKMKQDVIVIQDNELIEYYNDLSQDYQFEQFDPKEYHGKITVMEHNSMKTNSADSQVLILQDTPTEAQISFSKFQKDTRHKHVKFTWTGQDNKTVRSFESEKFYCYAYSKDQLSLPKFGMSKKQKWTQIGTNIYKAVSEYGNTMFEVLN